jgi:RNA polymerase sigma-70 factor (ECF subfamily)
VQDQKSIIQSFQNGDDFAFVSLYNRYKEGVYAFCCKMLVDQAAAKDVVQDTFVRVYENRGRLLNSDSFRSWLFTIARNHCYNYLRRTKRHVSLQELSSPVVTERESPLGSLERSEQIQLVNYLLLQLKLEYREVLVLREYQNLTYEEIAAVTRTSVSSVKSRLFKARRKLAESSAPWRERVRAGAEYENASAPIENEVRNNEHL